MPLENCHSHWIKKACGVLEAIELDCLGENIFISLLHKLVCAGGKMCTYQWIRKHRYRGSDLYKNFNAVLSLDSYNMHLNLYNYATLAP